MAMRAPSLPSIRQRVTHTLLVISLLWGLLIAFCLGAMLSGMIVQDSTLRLGRRYGVTLALESVLLLAAIPLFKQQQIIGALLAAMACGVQNAMATTYSGAIIRTSHVSGMFTDLGITIGHAIRGMAVDQRRLWLCLVIISAFLAGGVIGALAFTAFDYRALYLPALITGTTDLPEGSTFKIANDYNLGFRYARMFLDEEMDPYLQMDIEVLHTDPAARPEMGEIASHLDALGR